MQSTMRKNRPSQADPSFRRRNTRGSKTPIITNRDLDTVRVLGSANPPDFVSNPIVTRRVRFTGLASAGGLSLVLTPASLAAQDQALYGVSALRYSSVRLTNVEAWLAQDTAGTSAAPTIQVGDASSSTTFNDTLNPGVDWAHIAMRRTLAGRSSWSAVSSSGTLASVATNANTGFAGHYVVDCTCDFC